MKNCESFFQNRECQYFPCHAGADPETFNCLFCYCPLYALGSQCGGGCTYTEEGIKDCSDCLLPHSPGGYDYVLSQFSRVAELAKQNREKSH